MTRDKSGSLHLPHNRCPHRGNRVCMQAQGNARSFTCRCRGWTFANDGLPKGCPIPSGYEGVDRRHLGLSRVARAAMKSLFEAMRRCGAGKHFASPPLVLMKSDIPGKTFKPAE